MGKVFKEPKSYIQRVLMRSISRMNSTNWVEEEEIIDSGNSLTPFAIGDTINAIKFDTSEEKEAELLTFLRGINYGSEGYVDLISYDNGTTESGAPLTGVVLTAYNFNETYILMSANGDTPTPIYSTGNLNMDTFVIALGWQNLDENNVWKLNGQYTISEMTLTDSWNGILAGNATESTADSISLTAFNVGDNVYAIKFDTSKESELVAFLQGLPYEKDGEAVVLLNCIEEQNEEGLLMAYTFNGNYMLGAGNGLLYCSAETDMGDGYIETAGFKNLDENGVYMYTSPTELLTIGTINYSESWNGIFAGNASESAAGGVSLTAFEVDDVAIQYVFDTTKGEQLETYLTELFAANPDNDQFTLISSLEGQTNTKLLSAVNFQAGDNEMGPYALAIVDDREGDFVWVYATDNFEDAGVVKGFQNLTDGKYVAKNKYTITELGDSNIPDAFTPINGVIVGK